MFFQPIYPFSSQMISSSPLPNIHPEDIDCVIRSQIPTKGSLYVSNIEGVQNIATIKKLKVSCILTCSEGYKLDHPYECLPIYKYLPLPEHPVFSLNSYFDEATQFIKAALSTTNCIVHCLTGNGKSIIVLIAFLMKHYMMNYNDALLYIKRKRKLIQISQQYAQTLKQYEIHLKQRKPHARTQSNTMRYKTTKSNFLEQENNNIMLDPIRPTKQASQKQRQKTSSRMKSHLSIPQNNPQDRLISQCSHISVKNSHSRAYSSSEINSYASNKSKTQQQNNNNSSQFKQQKSKMMLQKINLKAPLAEHKEPIHFERVLSSNHREYVGVKRDFKNSSISQSKMLQSTADNSPIQIINKSRQGQLRVESQLDNQNRVNTSRLSKSVIDNKSQHSNNLNKSISHISDAKQKILTQNSQYFQKQSKKSSRLKSSSKYNPQEQLPQRKLAQSLQKSKISPSKRLYFGDINKQLNLNINSILTEYDSQFNSLRQKYHKKLRNLRFNNKDSENKKNAAY